MTKAVTLAELADQNVLSVDGANNRVGIASTQPTSTLDVAGIVSATAYYGDGSNLEGVASAGLGTALAEEGAGSVIYYTDKVLTVNENVTLDPPATTNVAYTQYAEIAVSDSYDLIVADGDDFIPDILGLSTETASLLGSSGGRVRADNFTNHAGTGAPTFQAGLNVTGDLDVTGNVSIAGTITYEDVTSIDSVGVITARSGIVATGVVTATSFANSSGNSIGVTQADRTLQSWLFGGG